MHEKTQTKSYVWQHGISFQKKVSRKQNKVFNYGHSKCITKYSKWNKLFRIPTNGRLTSWLFTHPINLNLGLLRTNPYSSRLENCTQGTPDVKSSGLNHSATLPPFTANRKPEWTLLERLVYFCNVFFPCQVMIALINTWFQKCNWHLLINNNSIFSGFKRCLMLKTNISLNETSWTMQNMLHVCCADYFHAPVIFSVPMTPKIILLHWNMSFSQFFLNKWGKTRPWSDYISGFCYFHEVGLHLPIDRKSFYSSLCC